MATSLWRRVDRIMRSLHLYTGLFLSPWMLVYATSAFCLNHDAWVRECLHVVPPSWELIREVQFVSTGSLSDDKTRIGWYGWPYRFAPQGEMELSDRWVLPGGAE